MTSFNDMDFLIVGHGLAGALLADALERRGNKPIVADASLPYAATPVAAGILNPVIGPRLNAPWRAAECLDIARETYRRMEADWEGTLFREFQILRLFDDEEMAKRWEQRRSEDSISSFLGKTFTSGEMQRMGVHSQFGAGEVLGTGALDTQGLVQASRRHLKKEGRYLDESIRHDDLPANRRIIFCEGFRVRDNPWFGTLPFAPVRGEILELQDERSECLNGGTWFLPKGDGKALAGSTFDWDNLECGPTEEGMQTILAGLDYLAGPKPKTTGQRSGIRPATRDRMPILGMHPRNNSLGLFNGFGSRGGTLIPLCADLFSKHLVEGKPLPEELDLRRFPESETLPPP